MTTVVGESGKQARKIQKAQAKTNNIGPQDFSADQAGGEWRGPQAARRQDPWSIAPVAWFPKQTEKDERLRTLRELVIPTFKPAILTLILYRPTKERSVPPPSWDNGR